MKNNNNNILYLIRSSDMGPSQKSINVQIYNLAFVNYYYKCLYLSLFSFFDTGKTTG